MKIFKKGFIILSILTLAFTCIACDNKSSDTSSSKPESPDPKKSVSCFFDALKKTGLECPVCKSKLIEFMGLIDC